METIDIYDHSLARGRFDFFQNGRSIKGPFDVHGTEKPGLFILMHMPDSKGDIQKIEFEAPKEMDAEKMTAQIKRGHFALEQNARGTFYRDMTPGIF